MTTEPHLKAIEDGKASPIYLVTGEEFLVRKAADEIVARLVPKAVAGLNLAIHEGASASEVARDLATVPMLRGRKVVVVRDPEAKMRDCYLFTTDLKASPEWVVTQFAWRWSIEVLFRSSKQVLEIEAPQQWSQESVEKVAPWVWSIQSVVIVWYLTAGRESAEAVELRERLGDWDSEWSLRHMIQVLRRAILNATINTNSAGEAQLCEMVQTLKNWANLAA